MNLTQRNSEKKTGLASISEAARYLNLDRATVKRLVIAERLTGVPIGRYRRIPWPEIYQFENGSL